MNRRTLAALLCGLSLVGCAAMMDGGPLTPTWRLETLEAARTATSLRLETNCGTAVINEPAAVARLLSVCSGRRWKTWHTTVPSHSPRQEIVLINGDEELKRFYFWGDSLWTSDGLSAPCFTPLEAEDRQWVASLFSFPDSETATSPGDSVTP